MKKKILLLLVSVFLIAVVSGAGTVFADDEQFTLNGTIDKSYMLGETIELPSATFTVSGVDYTAKRVIYFPDDSSSFSSSVTLSVRGNYKVDYSAVIDGTEYSREYLFSTIVPFGSFLTKKSSYNYWLNPDWDTLSGTGEYSSVTEKQLGLTVSIAKNDVFTVNEILDLKNAEKEKDLITFYFMPSVFGELDATKFYIKLTDAFNQSNTLTIEYRLGLGTYAYNVAKATDQVWAGLQSRYSEGNFTGYTPHINNSYGSVIVNNGGGLKGRYGDGVQPLSLYYISDECALYNDGYSFNSCLVDLDNEEYQLTPWKGFSSDYVYVSMWADSYNTENFKVFITNLCNVDLSASIIEDKDGPTVTVNSNGIDVYDMPEGGVGLKYKVFDAIATDIYAATPLKVNRKVLIGYDRSDGVYHTEGLNYTAEIDCSDGYFIPKRAGTYSIIYYSTDYSGNYTEVVSNVDIVSDFNDLSYITLSESSKSAEVGNRVFLSKVVDFGGYSGNYEIIYSVFKDGSSVSLSGNSVTGYSFVPESVGEYNVKVSLTDLVGGGVTESYNINVTEATMPSISDEVDFPAYFISEYTYKIPSLYAYDYNNGRQQIKANVKVKDGTGEWAYGGGDASFIADKNGCVEITYYVSDNERTYVVPVVSIYDNNDIIVSRLFDLYEGAVEISSVSKGVTVSSRNTDGSALFIKKVLSKTFASEFSVDKEQNDFEYLDIILSDSVERSDKIVITLKKESGSASVLINGKDTAKDISDVFSNGSKITLSFNETDNSIKIGDQKFYLTNNDLGETFDGFGSGYVYVAYGIRAVSSRSTIYIQKINNQSLNSGVVEDKVKPEFVLNGSYSDLVVEKGKTITVWSASYGDVLSNIISESVSVAFNGNSITDINGRIMYSLSCDNEYTFKASEYGYYTITYLIKDSANRKQGYTYMVNVVDMTAPVITTEMQDGEARLGDKITVANATAIDNREGQVKVYTYVICPNYQALDVNEKKSFYAREKGTYTVRYMAFDLEGNTTYKDYKIVVE